MVFLAVVLWTVLTICDNVMMSFGMPDGGRCCGVLLLVADCDVLLPALWMRVWMGVWIGVWGSGVGDELR